MISNILDKNIVKVLTLFLISPGSRHIRKEIKEKTNMNNVPLDYSLNKLLNLKILTQRKNLIMLNPEFSEREILEKIKKEINEFGVPLKIYYILLELSNKLLERKRINEVILFGSYAKLIYHEKSDMDIAIIFNNKIKNKKTAGKMLEKEISKIGKKYNQHIEIHFFIETDMKHKKDPLIKDILQNGKKLFPLPLLPNKINQTPKYNNSYYNN